MTTLLVKARALHLDEWRLLARALFTLARFRVALWILPWRRIRPARHVVPRQARFQPGRVEWAIRVASRLVPGATCLAQALALHHVLSRYGYPSTVQVGVRRQDADFLAHAWVEHDGQSLLGSAADLARYARVFTWPHSLHG